MHLLHSWEPPWGAGGPHEAAPGKGGWKAARVRLSRRRSTEHPGQEDCSQGDQRSRKEQAHSPTRRGGGLGRHPAKETSAAGRGRPSGRGWEAWVTPSKADCTRAEQAEPRNHRSPAAPAQAPELMSPAHTAPLPQLSANEGPVTPACTSHCDLGPGVTRGHPSPTL